MVEVLFLAARKQTLPTNCFFSLLQIVCLLLEPVGYLINLLKYVAIVGTGVDIQKLRQQELPNSNLTLVDLYRWAKALEVPVENLLVDHDCELSDPDQIGRIGENPIDVQALHLD